MQENRAMIEDQEMLAVSCPKWVQRKMRNSLRAAVTNRRDPVRARRAVAILAAIDCQAHLRETQMKEEPILHEPRAEAADTTPYPVETLALRGRRFIEGFVRRSVGVLARVRSTVRKSLGQISQRYRIGLSGAMGTAVEERTR